jgi:hypothetical protein
VGKFEIDTLDGLLQGGKYLENILNTYYMVLYVRKVCDSACVCVFLTLQNF